MALVANVPTERIPWKGFPEAPDLAHGLGSGMVEIDRWQDPSGTFSLVLARRLTVTDQDGRAVWKETTEWTYEEAFVSGNQWPTREHRTLDAWCWLPGVNHRADLIKVEETFKDVRLAGPWVAGPTASTTYRYAWVIFDLLPEKYEPGDVNAAAAARGLAPLRSTAGTVAWQRRVLETGRIFTAALRQSTIVEKPSAAQGALWQLVEIVQVEVDDDYLRTLTTTYTLDVLSGLLSIDGPNEERKKVSFEIPLPLEAPEVTATAATTSAHIEIRGGGGKVQRLWPSNGIDLLRPESYALYRRTVSLAGNPDNTDRFGLLASDPATSPAPVAKVEDTAVTDYAGETASALPAATSYDEPDPATPPVAESWELIAEPQNDETVPDMPGRAVVVDTGVEGGAVYDYKAIARVGGSDSPESAPSRITMPPGGTSGGMVLSVRGNGTEADVLLDEYGETVVVDVPALPPIDDLARDIGIRQAIADKDRDALSLTPPAPLFMLERGQLARVAPLAWTTWGRGLRIDSRLVDAVWRVQAFGFTATRAKDGSFTFKVDPIEMVEA